MLAFQAAHSLSPLPGGPLQSLTVVSSVYSGEGFYSPFRLRIPCRPCRAGPLQGLTAVSSVYSGEGFCSPFRLRIPCRPCRAGPCKKRWLLLPAQQLCFLFIFPPLEAGLPVGNKIKKPHPCGCSHFSCGEGGIRTPGAFQLNSFQDCRNRPLYHLSNPVWDCKCKQYFLFHNKIFCIMDVKFVPFLLTLCPRIFSQGRWHAFRSGNIQKNTTYYGKGSCRYR